MAIDLQPFATQAGSAAAIVGSGLVIWKKAVQPAMAWGRDLAHTGRVLANLASPVDPGDPDSPAVVVAAVAQAVSVAQEVRDEARAAAQAAEAAAGHGHEAVKLINEHAELDRASFEALAEWSAQIPGINPLTLPDV